MGKQDELTYSTEWTCECGYKNPLRQRNCFHCRKEIPKSEVKRIYREDIRRIELKLRNGVRRSRSRIEGVLRKTRKAVIPVILALLLIPTGLRIFLYPVEYRESLKDYAETRTERFLQDLPETETYFRNVRLFIGAVKEVPDRIRPKTQSLLLAFEGRLNESKKVPQEEKVDGVIRKFREVIDHVVRRSK